MYLIVRDAFVRIKLMGLNTPRMPARSPSPLPTKEHHIASGLGNHSSELCCAQPLPLPLVQLCIRYTDVTRASCSRVLAQASRERMTSVGCRHPHRIYVFTRIFGRRKPVYICQSDPTNSQAILQMMMMMMINTSGEKISTFF